MEVGKRGSLIVLREVHFQQIGYSSVAMDWKTKRFRVVSEDICTTEDRISKTEDFRYMFVLRLYCECTVFALFFKILYSFRKYRLYSG